MRTLRLVIAGLVLLVLMVLLAANWTWVELRLVPEQMGAGLPSLAAPLSAVIVAAFAVGFIFGELVEYIREHKHRARLAEKRRQVGTLQEENARLAQRLKAHGDEIGTLPG